MSNLSRRSLVTTAAALPALALPAVALASTGNQLPVKPDPIFAAIQTHRTYFEAANLASDELYKAETGAGATERQPYKMIEWRGYMFCADDIEPGLDWHLKQPNADRKSIEAEYPAIKAKAAETMRAEQEWYERHGLAELQAEKERLFEAEREAIDDLRDRCPTTIAGASALIDYIINAEVILDDVDWCLRILANIGDTLKASLAVQS